jgi:hypothetical protein
MVTVPDDAVIAGLTRTELIALVRALGQERSELEAALLDCYAALAPERVGVLLPETLETIRKAQT